MFILLKLLLILFRPVVWIVVLFLFAVLTKNIKRKKIAYRLALILLIFFTNPLFIRLALKMYEAKAIDIHTLKPYNTGIVLGGMVTYDQKMEMVILTGPATALYKLHCCTKQAI